LKFLSRAALQPDDFENPTISLEVSDVEERRSEAAERAATGCACKYKFSTSQYR
jgi:hypothetical protein